VDVPLSTDYVNEGQVGLLVQNEAMRRATLMAIGFLLLAGCKDWRNPKMQSSPDFVRFDFKSGAITVDASSLQKMKSALRLYVDGPNFPIRYETIRKQLQAELPSAGVWIEQGRGSIGMWTLEDRDDKLVLVHYPPPKEGTTYILLATLEPIGSGWKVVKFELERELGPR
jgi:hypothetical protein